MKLRGLSSQHVIAVWIGWPILLYAILIARTLFALRHQPPETRGGAVVLPPQLDDVTVTVSSRPLLALVLLGPPALVTALWLWRRRVTTP
jgi:hypothetical protein